ncbi:unnamed protein product, partial [Cyprideis torosa]
DFVEQVEVLMANPAASQPSFAVQLHPLVIMNISDHWTRIKAQEGSSKQVLGVILGTQQGRNLEIENSFELATLEVEDQLVLDLDYLNAKEVRSADPLLAQFGAIKMLHSRIKIILAFLAAMEGGAVPINYEILRDVSSLALANNLPLLNTEQFKQELSEQGAGVSLLAFLGVLTRAAQSVHQFVSKFNAVHDRGTSASRRMRGLLF